MILTQFFPYSGSMISPRLPSELLQGRAEGKLGAPSRQSQQQVECTEVLGTLKAQMPAGGLACGAELEGPP